MCNADDMNFLVVIETQKVKSYLFASPIMRETRGASILLDYLNRKETGNKLTQYNSKDYETIYLGGGGGRVLFRRCDDARKFKYELRDMYRRNTVNARVSVEIVERNIQNGKKEDFSRWISRGIKESQKKKLGLTEGVPILAGRWIQPCTSCGYENAEEIINEHGEHRLCRACFLKREEIREHLYVKIKSGKLHHRPLQKKEELEKRYTKRFIYTTLAQYTEDKGFRAVLPQDFNDIGDMSVPGNYMGFIYADGNRMGEHIKNLGTIYKTDEEAKLAYRAFSNIVDQATREAAVEAVLETVIFGEEEKIGADIGRFVPAEFIMAGGDDLMLTVPAQNALDVAVLFMDKFQEKTKTLQSEYMEKLKLSLPFDTCGLTSSAGVVIAHAHYPVSDLVAFAGELMKMAKKKEVELEEGQKAGTLDFMVLSEAGSESIKERRKKEYQKIQNGKSVRLTERPYTTFEARGLMATIRSLKKSRLPRSKLKALYPALFQSPMQAQFNALRIKERLKTTGDLKEGSVLHSLAKKLMRFPFQENENGDWSTPFTEIIELYDFVTAN